MNVSGKYEVYNNPTLKEAAFTARKCVDKKRFLLIAGKCWVDYLGRASSHLGLGERILIIKKDGALLVHRPNGYEPVNWMPSGNIIRIELIKPKRKQLNTTITPSSVPFQDILRIRALRRRPSESIDVFFQSIYLLSTLSLIDRGEFYLYASEKDMQRAILLKPSIIENGFQPISYEKKIEPGFVDVYGIDREGKFVVIEIKRKTAGREAIIQLAKYVKSIKTIVNGEVRGIVVAPQIAKGVQRLLTVLELEYKQLDPQRCVEILGKSATKKISDFLK